MPVGMAVVPYRRKWPVPKTSAHWTLGSSLPRSVVGESPVCDTRTVTRSNWPRTPLIHASRGTSLRAQDHRLRDVRLRARLAVDPRDVDVELEVLRAVTGGESLAVEHDATRVALLEGDVGVSARRDASAPCRQARTAARRWAGRPSSSAQGNSDAGLVHRTLDRIRHDGQIRGSECARQRWHAPRKAQRDEPSGAPLPSHLGRGRRGRSRRRRPRAGAAPAPQCLAPSPSAWWRGGSWGRSRW